MDSADNPLPAGAPHRPAVLLLATCVLLGAGLAPRTGLAKRLAVLEFKGSALTSEGLGSKLRLTTNSYDTRSGNLLRTAEAAAGDVDGLIAGLPAACRELFAPEAPPPPPPPPSSRPRLVVAGPGQARAEVVSERPRPQRGGMLNMR